MKEDVNVFSNHIFQFHHADNPRNNGIGIKSLAVEGQAEKFRFELPAQENFNQCSPSFIGVGGNTEGFTPRNPASLAESLDPPFRRWLKADVQGI